MRNGNGRKRCGASGGRGHDKMAGTSGGRPSRSAGQDCGRAQKGRGSNRMQPVAPMDRYQAVRNNQKGGM